MSIGSLASGVSREAGEICRKTRRARTHLHTAASLGDESAALQDLQSLWSECQSPNWDGYGAQRVTRATYRQAFQFLKSLPLGCPSPSVGAEADGELTMEWYRGPRRTLSISMNDTGDVHYAALLGPRKAYGAEMFFGEVPDRILELIREVTRT